MYCVDCDPGVNRRRVGVSLYDPARPLHLEELISGADAQIYEQRHLRGNPQG